MRELQARFTAQAEGFKNTMRTMAKDMKMFGKDSQKSVQQTNSEYRKLEQTLGGLQDEIKQTKQQMGQAWDDSELKELERAIQKVKDELRTTGTVGEESMEDFRRVLRESRTDLANLGEGNPFSNLVAQIEVTESSVQALNQLELNNLQQEFDQVAQNVNESNSNIDTFRTNLNTLEDALRTSTNVQGFEELNRTLQAVQEELRTTGRVSVENMQALNQALGVSQTEINQLGNASGFQDLIQQINLVQSSMQQMGNQGAADLQEIETAAQQAQAEINELGSIQLNELQAEMDDVSGGLDDAGESSQQAEGTMVGAFGGIKAGALLVVGAIAGVVAGVVGMIKAGDDLQRALNHLQVQTGASNKEMEGMESHLINIYKNNFGESFEDIATSMALVKQATGETGDALEDTTTKAILLRDSFGFEVNESMKVARVMMDQFGISADEAFTLLAQGQEKGLNTSEDMMDSFWEYSVYFKELGFDAEEMWDTFKAGADAGAFNMDKVGDAVKEFGIRIHDGATSTTDALSFLFQSDGFDEFIRNLQSGGTKTKEFMELASKVGKENATVMLDQLNKTGTASEKTYKEIEYLMGGAGALLDELSKGSLDGKDAMQQIIDKISEIEDKSTQEQIGTALFGSQWEDLKSDVMLALGEIKNEADMTADTLGKINEVKYDSVGEALVGVWRMINGNLLIPLQQKLMPGINQFVNMTKGALEGIIAMFKGDNIQGIDLLTKLGLSTEQIVAINNAVNMVKQALSNVRNAVTTLFNFLAPYIMPLLESIVTFIGEKVAQITKFWDENGELITKAARNAFNLILSIIQVVMPVVLAIIEMVWNNIKGVINGALNVIMGALKVFAALFTGDFSKMWEGIKQMFGGAIEFVWNLINLLLIGRVIGGIKSFISAGIAAFRGFWTNVVNIFRNLDSSVSSLVGRFVNFLKNSWNTASSNASSIFTNIKNTIAKIWDDIVDGAKALPGKIGDGIKRMAGKAADGVKTLANNLMSNLGLGVNGVIGGVNWILSKVGVESKIPKWDVPQYAKGTDGHKGGPMIIGDGGQQELVRYPDGTMYLSPNKNTLVPDAPKGTTVLSGGETKKLLSMGVPGYAKGVGDFFNFVGGKISSGAKYVKDKALDVWDMVSDPAKMLKKVLEDRGFSFSLPGAFKDAAGGILNKITSGAVGFLKDKLEGLGSLRGNVKGGVAAPSQVKSWVTQALNMTSTPLSWLPAMLVKAQKESGYNPRAINLWDINAKRGIPSKGLFQTIDPTFNAYKMRGMNDIYNPIHNAVAAIRYIKDRYGTVFNTPGMRSMARGGGYKGYFEGARVAAKQLAWIAERGAEYVIPTDGGHRAYELWNQAGVENGFTSQSSNGKSSEKITVKLDGPLVFQSVLNGRVIAEETYEEISSLQKQKDKLITDFGGG